MMTPLKIPKYSFSSLKTTLSSSRFSFNRSSSIALAADDQEETALTGHTSSLCRVFLYMSVSDLLVCSLVSKLWRNCSHSAQLWQRFILFEEIPIGPQWNYLLEKHEKEIGYAWKMIYFHYHRTMRHWREIIYTQRTVRLLQQIKCINGDFENLVIGTENGINILNDTDNDHKFYPSGASITSLCVNHEYLAVADKSGEVILWNLINSTREASIKQKDSLGFSSLIFHQDTFLIGSAFNGNIYIFSFKSNLISTPTTRFKKPKVLRQTTISLIKIIHGHHSDIFTMIKINNSLVATGSTDHSIKIWDITDFKCLKVIKGHDLDILCLASNDEFLWSGSMDKSIKKWNINTFELDQTLVGHTDWVKVLLKLPRWLISGGFDEYLLFWNNDGQLVSKIDLKYGPISACLMHHQNLVINCQGRGHGSEIIIFDFS